MTGYIPTLEQIDELHRKIAPSKAAYELVHTHCVIVATIGCQIVRRQNALFTRRCTLPKDAEVPPTTGVTGGHVPPRLLDEHLVLIGGLLHDIGTYRVFKHDGSDGEPLKFSKKRYILHGLKGYSICSTRAWTSPSPSSAATIPAWDLRARMWCARSCRCHQPTMCR